MNVNLVADAELSRDVYDHNNSGEGALAEWRRIAVARKDIPPASNFAAQLYGNTDGKYKLAFRGTADILGSGDIEMNGAILTRSWSKEMDEAARFTYYAIKQIALERGVEFDEACHLFSVTGHSQGGFEAELVAHVFGLDGTSFDGPGANGVLSSQGMQDMVDWIKAREPEAKLNIGVRDFITRSYTAVIDLVATHAPGVVVDNDTISVSIQKSLILTPFAVVPDLAIQAFFLHPIDNIIELEKLRQSHPFLQKIVEVEEFGVDQALALTVSEQWAYQHIADNGVTVSADTVQAMVNTFLAGRDGQSVQGYKREHNLLLVTDDGAHLMLRADGSGWMVQSQGVALVQTDFVPGGAVDVVSTIQRDDDGNALVTRSGASLAARYTVDGIGQVISGSHEKLASDGSIESQTLYERHSDGTTTVEVYDQQHTLQKIIETQLFDDGSGIVTTTTDSGVVTSYFASEALVGEDQSNGPLGSTTLIKAVNRYGGTLIDSLSLLRAIQSGQPLPIAVSGLRLANSLTTLHDNPLTNLSGASNVAGGVLSLLSLKDALERGDEFGAVTAAANAVNFGAAAYANFAGFTDSKAGSAISQAFGQDSPFTSLNQSLPYLNLVNAIAHGDETGIAVASISLIPGMQWVGIAYGVYSMIDSLFGGGGQPDPWGTGRFSWNGTGIGFDTAGESGGDQAVERVMRSVQAMLENIIEQERQQNPGSALGVIPNRMPGIGYDMTGYRYTDIDPLTGGEQHPGLRFDVDGRPYNADPGSPESYRSLVVGMFESALRRGAIAPLWEVRTAKIQSDAGDPKAGLTEEERAARDGMLAAPNSGDFQLFRPVALDLDGDGIETTDIANGVAFNVDSSGFLKRTAWINSDDAFLVLDRDYNGIVDNGREMFANAAIALARRGLAGMAWVDSNYDGRLTPADPVWQELLLWRDFDQNGAQSAGELARLDDVGITELDYSMGTYATAGGMVRRLASPDLQADREGTRVKLVKEGILIEYSENGHLSLLVTRIDDKTAVAANRDGITGLEDVEVIVNGAELTANDLVGGIAGRPLQIAGLANFRHGSGFIDVNGFVHFLPEADYDGDDAGFDYIALAENGQQANGTVDVALTAVNDAPAVTSVTIETRPIYGYTDAVRNTEDWHTVSYLAGNVPLYAPYGIHTQYFGEDGTKSTLVYDPPLDRDWEYQYHLEPVATEQTGRVIVQALDRDDPAESLRYEVINQPQFGEVSLNDDGTFQYTDWKAPGVPSDRMLLEGDYIATYYEGQVHYPGRSPDLQYPSVDAFRIRISDPEGASVETTITVNHHGPYMPTMPTSGGGTKPISVDLTGNGFNFVGVDDSNVFFDVNGDGWRRRTAWVGKDDGLLAYDTDGDGLINQLEEISFVGYSDTAQTDLQGLAAFDSNGNGMFDPADEKWHRFGIWQDADQDGNTDPGEFNTLSEWDVASIGLHSDGQFQVIDGQTVHGIGALTLIDGSTMAIADVTLATGSQSLAQSARVVPADPRPFAPSGEKLAGTPGADLLLGRHGDTIINSGDGDDVIFEDIGNDVIDTGDGDDIIYAGQDNDLVIAGNGSDAVFAGWGDDLVFGGDGEDALLAEGGNDVVFAGAGNDFVAGGPGNDVVSGDGGDDVIYGESGNDALFGGIGDDQLSGMDGNDYLMGGDGHDRLDGGAGSDQMIGGAGDDFYAVDDVGDTITEEANGGTDTVHSRLATTTLGANVENLTLADIADVTGDDDSTGIGNPDGIGNLIGIGNELDNRLTGNAGDNLLLGGAGDDILDGGAGDDTLVGGSGDDIYMIDSPGDTIQEQRDEGVDQVFASVSATLAPNVENLVLIGGEPIDGNGNELDNRLTGNVAANRLDGGSGADLMDGGDGDDTYIVDHAGDRVVESPGGGIDTVLASISLALAPAAENLVLTGAAHIDGSGNEADNHITGNTGNNLLAGGTGNDTLEGGAGSDTLQGGSGGDMLLGGDGNDTLQGDHGNDWLQGGAGDDLYVFANGDGLDWIDDESGLDTVRFEGPGLELENLALRISSAGSREVAELRVLDEHGNAQPDQGFDFLPGRDADGLPASPIERFELADGSVVTFDDLLVKTRIVAGAKSPVIITGRDDDIVYAGPRNNQIRTGTGNDIVYGSVRADVLSGEGGNDRLLGANGDDTIDGGWGNDVLVGDHGRDLLRDLHGNNIFIGGMHDDLIEAGAGNDFIAGGKHGDRIIAGGGDNVIAFNRGDGHDTLVSSAGSSNTLSLGGGITVLDLWFRRTASDLVLHIGPGDQLTLEDWYAGTGSRSVHQLQLIGDSNKSPSAPTSGSTEASVELFDFHSLVEQYEASQAKVAASVEAKRHATAWALVKGMPAAAVDGHGDEAIGGELATSYALHGTLSPPIDGVQAWLREPGLASLAIAATLTTQFDAPRAL